MVEWSVTIRGTRGSLSSTTTETRRTGGATSMLEVRTEQGVLLVDTGSSTPNLPPPVPNAPILIWYTHFHHDHIVGLPFLSWLYDPAREITFLGVERHDMPLHDALCGTFQPPWFPLPFADAVRARIREVALPPEGREEHLGLRIEWTEVAHPGGASALRISDGERSLVYAPDVELDQDEGGLLRLSQGADVLVIDAHFSESEYPNHRGWGHSTPQQAARLARDAQAGSLRLTHHAPWRSDDEVDALARAACEIFPGTEPARDGDLLLQRRG